MSRRTRRSAVDQCGRFRPQCGRFRPQCGRFRPQCGRFSDRSAVVSHRSAVDFHTALRSIFTAVRSFPPAVRERFIPQCGPQIPHRGTAVRSSSPALRPRPVAEPRPVASNPLPTCMKSHLPHEIEIANSKGVGQTFPLLIPSRESRSSSQSHSRVTYRIFMAGASYS
jgi:hypothetical protein